MVLSERSRLIAAILIGIGLLLGIGSIPTAVFALRSTKAPAAVAPPVLEQGVFARVLRGQLAGKEAFTLLQHEGGFELITNAEFQGQTEEFEQRLATSLSLDADFQLQRYRLVQIVEYGDGTLELMGGQLTVSGDRAQSQVRWTHPEPYEWDQAWTLPDLPLVVLQPNVMSSFSVLVRLFQSLGAEEAVVAYLHPFQEEVRTARLRRLDPVTITFEGGEAKADRLELVFEPAGETLEILLKDGEFIGAVAAGFGEDRAFLFRWDLFPEGFSVKR